MGRSAVLEVLLLTFPHSCPAILVLGQEGVEVGLRTRRRLCPLVCLPATNFQAPGLERLWLPRFTYDHVLAFSRLGLRGPNQHLLPFELDRVHVSKERILVEFHPTVPKLQSSFINGRLNLTAKDIAIISSMRK